MKKAYLFYFVFALAISVVQEIASQNLVINEILADPSVDVNGDGTLTNDDEFIEIYNNGSASADLSDYTLEDATGTRHTFASGTILEAGGYISVFSGGAISGVPGLTQTASTGTLGLNNGGDTVVFKNDLGEVLETYTYSSEGGANQSLAKYPDYTGFFIQHSLHPSNQVAFSPGEKNGNKHVVVINEILADPASDANGDGVFDGYDEFVEIYNTSSTDFDLSNCTLSDGAGVRHTFPNATILPANSFITVFGGGVPTGISGIVQVENSETYDGLGLNNGGDVVTLLDSSGLYIDVHQYEAEGGDNQSVARNPDFTGSFVKHTTIAENPLDYSPGAKNAEVTLAVKDVLETDFKIYPNPATSGYVNISGQDGSSVNVEVYNMLGNRVLNSLITENNNLDITNLKKGMYLIRLVQEKRAVTKKLIVK